MACFHPWHGWKHKDTGLFRQSPPQEIWRHKFERLEMPCGKCLGCGKRAAREWSIRATRELRHHEAAAWVTLTFAPEWLPMDGTVHKSDLSAYIKRLRARTKAGVRFFGCGEYGEDNGRPHYHVVVYGLPPSCRHLSAAWEFGRVSVDAVSPANIAYTAGYTTKKLGEESRSRWIRDGMVDVVDQETGEVLGQRVAWRKREDAPFLLMSRRPGLGSQGAESLDGERVVWQGREYPVPRLLREKWEKAQTGFYVDDEGNVQLYDQPVAYQQEKRRRLRRTWTPDERAASEAVEKSRRNLRRRNAVA